jgi:lipoprotein signal peptidase
MLARGLILALVILLADQASKWWILEIVDLDQVRQVVLTPFLNLTMVWNRGITFGLFSGGGPWNALILAAIAVVIVAVLLRWMARAETRLVALALGAVAGGAIGNVIDRLRFGAVVDFVDVHAWGFHWYVFNVADAAIVCGVGVLLADALFRRRKPAREGVA